MIGRWGRSRTYNVNLKGRVLHTRATPPSLPPTDSGTCSGVYKYRRSRGGEGVVRLVNMVTSMYAYFVGSQWRKVEESNSDAVTSPGFRDRFGNPLAGTFLHIDWRKGRGSNSRMREHGYGLASRHFATQSPFLGTTR